ncbi:MAG TPA: 7-cyano-7-deazaguanine synthase QueC [Bdellovibrionota bacterium]|jgi:7-cyano-7-deazaguanine synthase|nr:7-cyano-7-deazaguanine synthase QueC [Bdellovibrionota bacterium]
MSGSALMIFSGGQDSTTCLYWAIKKYDHVEAITFDYRQRHRTELDCAQRICEKLAIPQKIVNIDFLSTFHKNALTSDEVEVSHEGGLNNLPSTFVPGRNALFFTIGAALAVSRGIDTLVSGVCQTDYSGYPDCRDDFVRAQEKTLSLAMGSPIYIETPLMHLTKAETFRLAADLGELKSVVEDSHTCYEGDRTQLHAWGYGCGKCPACELRRRGFEEFLNG